MRIVGVNGSPRKGWNTHILVEESLRGAASKGAETELVNLYDLDFRGCISCFQCKRQDGPSLGRCILRDSLRPVLDALDSCDGFILGSPIYVGEVTASMRALIERLTFQYISYGREGKSRFTRRVPVGFIYTMNIPEAALDAHGYTVKFRFYEDLFSRIVGPVKTLLSTETWQTEDYGKYGITAFDEGARRKRREEVFPRDRQRAFDLGSETAGPPIPAAGKTGPGGDL
jgi:multimeric flavodoxin WrbA